MISTHVPRTGHDVDRSIDDYFDNNFNPRAPYGARRAKIRTINRLKKFQPTCPVRGTTKK